MPLWIGLLFAAVLLLHACNYLYFFVDDEAIPYVYAQNLLNGKGLSYNSFEGRVEGYSDFLHVWLAVGILGVVRLLGLNKLAVFEIGTVLSLCCGAGLVFVAFLTLRRMPHVEPAGVVSGLAFLTLSGALAVWSCSSLEIAAFAFLIALLLYLLVSHATGEPLFWMAGACAAAALLTRIDGFVYVGALVGSALVFAEPGRRRALWRTVVAPATAVFALYLSWRVWYFRELLPMPLYAKVLYKLNGSSSLVTKSPDANYGLAFFGMYGLVPIGVVCTAWIVRCRSRLALSCLTSAAVLVAYLAVVGDWMFGFRFFVPVLPLLAILIAGSVSMVAARARIAGWMVTAACVVWFTSAAYGFGLDYKRLEGHDSWLAHPSLDPRLHFSRYYSLFEEARGYMHSGDVTAYDQAGFLPFMLDLDNIDDLGICSKFYSKLPTTDIFFTEVGRYEPLTNKPALRAGEAYLLYREPRFIVEPLDLLRKANVDLIPDEVLGGYYERLFVDQARQNVVYGRTERGVREFKTEPRRFLENLVHVSRLRTVRINEKPVAPSEFQRVFPWLRDERARFTVGAYHRIDLEFGREDEPVYEVHVDQLLASRTLTVVMTLRSREGRIVYRTAIDIAQNQARDFRDYLAEPVGASQLSVEVAGALGEDARLEIADVRVQGQPRALSDYIARNLKFPAP